MLRSNTSELILAALLASAAPTQERPQVSASALRRFDDIARELVRAGRPGEAEALLGLLQDLTADPAGATRLREQVRKERQRAPDARSDVAVATRLARATALLAAEIARQSTAAATRQLAAAVLALDDSVAAAHEALGRRRTDDGWLDDAGVMRATRRKDWAAAIARARTLDFEIEQGQSDNPLVRSMVDEAGGRATWHDFVLHMFEGRDFAAATLRRALRAATLLAWIRTGSFEFRPARPWNAVMTAWQPVYLDAVARSLQEKALTQADATAARQATLYDDARGFPVFVLSREELVPAWIVRMLSQDCVIGIDEGALNLACHAVLGCFEDRRMQHRKPEPKEYEVWYYTGPEADASSWYAHAGALGARRFLVGLGPAELPGLPQLVGWRTDDVTGPRLLLSTALCNWLIETGKSHVLSLAAARLADEKNRRAALAELLDQPLAEFERGFQGWLRPAAAGMVQRLLASADELAPLRQQIDAVRKQALGEVSGVLHSALRWNPALDRGCADLLRARAGAPPTAAGAEAGLHVVEGAGSDGASALAMLMTSVAGRAGLLDAGTLEAGLAFANGRLVVDVGSVRHPVMTDFIFTWPRNRSTGVPTGYAAGLPSPSVEVQATELGYPLTCHLGFAGGQAAPRIVLRVAEAGNGTYLPGFSFAPDRPLPGCEPPWRVWGLIPKSRLKSDTRYVLEVQVGRNEPLRVEFTTARR